MKKWAVVLLIAIVVGLFWSCSDDSSTVPGDPYLEVNIVNPIDSSEFRDGENVTIEVEAVTNVGSISEVVLVIDRFTQCEKFVDNNYNGYFDREEFVDNNANSNWDQGESYIDANLNNQYNGDFLYDSNTNNLWDFWDIGENFSGFNGDVYSNVYFNDFHYDNIVGNSEIVLQDASRPYSFNIQAKIRYIDEDFVFDTGEPYVDQKKFYNTGNQIIEIANGNFDENGEICNLTLKDNGVDYTETYAGGSIGFWERLDEIKTNVYYLATLQFDADSSNVTINYKRDVFLDLRSSLGSETQPTPRLNDIYDSVGNGIQDEFEAYCTKNFYGSYDVNDNILGWTEGHTPGDNPSDYFEFVGSYTIFKCPVEFYSNMPNISDLPYDSYSTWIDTNNNGYFDTYDPLESDVSSSKIEAIATDNNGNSVSDTIFINIKQGFFIDTNKYSVKNQIPFNIKP